MNQSEYLFYIQISYKLWHIMMFEEKEVKTLKNELSEPTITIPTLLTLNNQSIKRKLSIDHSHYLV